jgi:transcriptional regulator with XRE-family HTH domain
MSLSQPDEATVGQRLRALRLWRGMSLSEVAGLAGLSAPFLSMAERGLRTIDRRSTISALAGALRVSETDLTGGPHLGGPDRVQSGPHSAVPAIRVALQTNTLTQAAVGHARPLSELCAVVTSQLEPMRRVCDYVRIGALLPDVLDEMYWHAVTAAGDAAERAALEALVECCVITAAITKELGYLDVAYLAATRAKDAAALLGDPVQIGKADFMWLQALSRAGSSDRGLAAAERAADQLQPAAASPLGIQVLGMLTLSAALSAAIAGRGDRADHWLGEARCLAAQVPDDPKSAWQSFSSANVAVWRTGIAVERGETGSAVLAAAQDVNLDLFEAKGGRRAMFCLDVGRGLARSRRTHSDAVRWLRRAEDIAPSRIRNSSPARETVAYLMLRARAEAGGRELRGMAARIGIQH